MHIDWITLLAQLVNFGVLIWLLKRLLYQPILTLIAAREADISKRFEAAAAQTKEAEEEKEWLRADRSALKASREGVMEDARQSADALSKKIERQAKDKAAQAQRAWMDERAHHATKLNRKVAQNAAVLLEQVAARCLHDLADEPLQHAMAKRFIATLQNADANTNKIMISHLQDKPIKITTQGTASPETRTLLETAIRKLVNKKVGIEFASNTEISPGLILEAGGQTYAWTIDSYLAEFSRALNSTLEDSPAMSSASLAEPIAS